MINVSEMAATKISELLAEENKAGSGRPKDLADLDNLPEAAPRTSRKRKPSATRRKPRGKGK